MFSRPTVIKYSDLVTSVKIDSGSLVNKYSPRSLQTKSLVATLHGYLSKILARFREHINYVVMKLNTFCGLIYRVRDLYPRKCLLMFYNSFARSIISYGILVYGSAAKTNLKKIENAQRKIIRAIFFQKEI